MAPRWYDLALAFWTEQDDLLVRELREECARRGADFFLVEPLWIDGFLQAYQAGRLGVGLLVDLASEPMEHGDAYLRLALTARERGARVINDTGQAARFSDKGVAHEALRAAGLPVPYGVAVSLAQAAARNLSAEERERLGVPFYVKPSHGFACRGVLSDGREMADIRRSHAIFPDTHYLLQRRVEIAEIAGRPAYWRVFHVLGEVHLCWWHPVTRHYSLVTAWQVGEYRLQELLELGRRLAVVTGLDLFSVEVARTPGGEFLLVDYVNDQIDLRSQSYAHDGIPDELVRHVACRLAAAAERELARRPADPVADVHRERLQASREANP